MPKSTKIRMLRNTSTNTCHEVNLCVTIAYGTYTLSLQYYGVTKFLKYVVSELKNHQVHQTQKKVVENIQEYLNLIKYSTFYPVSVVERKKRTRPVIVASFSR